ncbi:homoserine O-acetyltransferase [Tersicoccus phoenicis]|uniref:Homoserine O-acetyltransferase n=1 Tax=Tersicoccus phoenicis TaxID=554083 RepID=A0A1R1L8W5_9MICC|nr:homoserine O-acetyltransferase [Tersicoccus phoenicis]OMH23980.1 homoserine O-acetyltransferase [Tersicoccus phoenicis]
MRFGSIGDLQLETGGVLPDVVLAYETWGTLNADASNAVLVHHALTGSSHVARGDTDVPGWWDALVGPGCPLNTDELFVVSVNMVGGCYGSTGPSSFAPDGRPWGSRFPLITLRDAAHAEKRLAEALGIDAFAVVIGGSMGGARALEWAVTYPEAVRHCAVLAIGASSTAEQIAWAQPQVLAIRNDPHFADGNYYDGPTPDAGLGIARRIAHITYRSEAELGARFGRRPQTGEDPLSGTSASRGRYAVESYLDHKATSLAGRFDANSYLVLSDALMSHDVARGRGGLERALAGVRADFLVAAVTSDRLYLPEQSFELAAALPGDVPVHLIDAAIGHDGFLTEMGQLGALLDAHVFGR